MGTKCPCFYSGNENELYLQGIELSGHSSSQQDKVTDGRDRGVFPVFKTCV